MCGIIGYVGRKNGVPVVLNGLKMLEYRGYDSAGLAALSGHTITIRKRKGTIDSGLAPLLIEDPLAASVAIGHTRWATHGPPTDGNSHPHMDLSGRIAVVHNGIIENHERLRERLRQAGHVFRSATDTEVLAHLIGRHYQSLCPKRSRSGTRRHPLATAVRQALKEVTGTYAIAVICADYPDLIIGARRDSPLLIGITPDEHLLASDANAIISTTNKVADLEDGDVATLTPQGFSVERGLSGKIQVQFREIPMKSDAVERGEFPHYMLKEIYEQPCAVSRALSGRLKENAVQLDEVRFTNDEIKSIDRIIITACGTSRHAALIAEYLIEELSQIPVEVEYASEYRYRNAPASERSLLLAISQSGETADTLAAVREAKRRNLKVLALCNVPNSTIAREADGVILLKAGPEIGVASTKAFTSQTATLTLLALWLGQQRNPEMVSQKSPALHKALSLVPAHLEAILRQNELIRKLSVKYAAARDVYFLGRHVNYPIALEGALKLKEISYIHAEGYPAAEMKHGPIALLDSTTPVIGIAPADAMFDKMASNLQTVKARGTPVIAITTEGNREIQSVADDVIYLPQTCEAVFPLLAIVPLQLFAYHAAVGRGCDVDKPRNLAKSVTVE